MTMTVLSSLTMVASDRAAMRVRGIESMRQKLIDRIGDQIELAKATEAGLPFQRIKYRRVRDLESEEVTETAVKTRIRPWWTRDKDGSILLWIKYGNQVLELQRGKPAIRVASNADLVGALETVQAAVRAGELDKVIEAAVNQFKKRFNK
ncbi:DUF6641 family protein [Sphingomonas sanguinis]|uniref:DUF6641 family protein n=1 Tax=Sphingomonas sanguinis TaxID=33051 RepID=UPI00077C0258|nr:DUF6641 family protein [Sphingomonas sanguinis]